MAAEALEKGQAKVDNFSRPWSCLLALLVGSASGGACYATEAAVDREAQMAAAYVFNFVKFVEWPRSAAVQTMQVCFIGAAEVREALAAATADKVVGARPVTIKDASKPNSVDDCQVIYIDSSMRGIAVPSQQGALTIGDHKDFTREGGVIRLYTENNRLRFTVNVDNAKRSGLQVSSNLLQLATNVEQVKAP